MWPYLVLYLLAAFIAYQAPPATISGKTRGDGAFIGALIILTILIGYRYQVGGDWEAYILYFNIARRMTFDQLLTQKEPAYQILNWISAELGWGIWGVNVVSGLIFSWGLIAFCRGRRRPWLALAVAIPYIVIVVAMGYTRQSIALGLEMLCLVALLRGSNSIATIYAALAVPFHTSALVLLPLPVLVARSNKYLTALAVCFIGGAVYYSISEKTTDYLVTTYVTNINAAMQSEGALIRLSMNLVSALLFIIWRKRFQFSETEARLWTMLSIASFGLMALYIATPASTAADRIGLYLLPLQVAVFAGLPDIFYAKARPASPRNLRSPPPRSGKNEKIILMAVLLYYGAVLFVWLSFGNYSAYWQPYRSYLFEEASL